MSIVVRAMAAFTLLVLLLLLAVVQLLALVAAAYLILRYNGLDFRAALVLLGLVGVAIPLLQGMWVALRAQPPPQDGVLLPLDSQPLLWDEVHRLAETVGTRPPDEIRLVGEVNASVSEESRWLGLRPGRRVMRIGAPLVRGLSRQQLRAVLAHELGHYGRRHTRLATLTYRGRRALVEIIETSGRQSWTGRFFYLYLRLYAAFEGAVSRRQELEADGFSLLVAGRDAAATSLRTTVPLERAWQRFLGVYVEDGARLCGKRPADLFGGFDAFLRHPETVRTLEKERCRELPTVPMDRFDTHPPLAFRVDLLESSDDDGRVDDGSPAADLLDELPSLLHRMGELAFEGSDLEPASWQDLAAEVGPRRARWLASLLVGLAASPGQGARDLDEALRQLGRGSVRDLAGPLLGHDASLEDVRAAAVTLVAGLVESALVDHCGARHVEGWSGSWGLQEADGAPVDVRSLVEAVVGDRDGASSLLDALAREGVPRAYTVSVEEGADDRAEVAGAVSGDAGQGRVRVVLVTPDRVVVAKYGLIALARALLKHKRLSGFENALLAALSSPLPDVEQRPGSYSVPLGDLEWVELKVRRGELVRLELRGGGQALRVKASTVVGDLVPVLVATLGPRARFV